MRKLLNSQQIVYESVESVKPVLWKVGLSIMRQV